jgi:hypothetical protein
MRWTGASERSVKYWFAGERGPSGEHLLSLARHSDAVLIVLLALADRLVTEHGEEWAHPPAVPSGGLSRERAALVSCSFLVILNTDQEGSVPCLAPPQ